jgi:hypothetical protein
MMNLNKNLFFLSLIVLLVSGCAIFKGKGKFTHISFKYDLNAQINYGKSFPLKVMANYANGKTKNISSKSDLKVKVRGARYSNEKIVIGNYPQKFKEDVIYFKATYAVNDKFYTDSIKIPFNYLGGVKLSFQGNNGAGGEKGGRGKTSVLFRHGKDGESGGNGADGGIGDDLSVYVWKENNLFMIKVYNMVSDKSFFYKAKDKTSFFKLLVYGGSGGEGGNAGNGGDGKNGVKKDEKIKKPGQGGNGGNGGNGGAGGQGGSVYAFVHPSAASFKEKIQVLNNGGVGGKAGSFGKGGDAGSPLEGQDTPSNGNNGVVGINGMGGSSGDVISIEVQDFDIEDVKNN